jgi:hypothetical protein
MNGIVILISYIIVREFLFDTIFWVKKEEIYDSEDEFYYE